MALGEELASYQAAVNAALDQEFAHWRENRLQEACRYALLNGGKRIRPALVMMIGEALGQEVMPAAMAIELHHTATLIADDLPCMDDDEMRRGQPSVHIAYDEAIALLATFSLIAEGYRLLAKGEAAIVPLALEKIAAKTGLPGVTGGQFLDIYGGDLWETIERKTAALFEASFILGWLYGGGDPALVDQAEACGTALGNLFQLADDLQDYEEDLAQDKPCNTAIELGVEGAKQKMVDLANQYLALLEDLSIDSTQLQGIAQAVVSYGEE